MSDKEALHQNTYQRGMENANAPVREPGPMAKAKETLGYIGEVEMVLGRLRRSLYGPFPEPGLDSGKAEKRTEEPALEEMLHVICQRTAMIAGELQSILGRL